jgi:fatty-acyl-CoA synthase
MLYGQMMNYPLTTHSIIEYGNRVFPHKEIVSKMPDGSWHRYTNTDMYKRCKKLAHALINRLGIRPGDRVATFAWNHYQHFELYFAIPGVGAVCHPLNIRLSAEQVEYIVNHAEDQVVFLDASLIPLFKTFAHRLSTVRHIILINGSKDSKHGLPNILYYEDLVSEGSDDFEWIDVEENQACAMCYTSGTTGDPKGVLYSHRSTYLHALTTMSPNAANIGSAERALAICPMFHVMGWGFPYICLLAGADIILPSCHLQPAALIDMMQREKITIANGVPTIWMGVYEELKRNPPVEPLLLKEYMVGGSAMPPGLIRRFQEEMGITCFHAWGMTETSPVVTASRLQFHQLGLGEEAKIRIRAKQGIEMPGVEIRVVQEDGSIAPRDGKTVGEFEVRGHWVISGYYKLENINSHTGDGWFRTGDVGTIDTMGYMELTDRTKDLIKSGGEWISSVALETTLMNHPKVSVASVIAIPDKKWMERPLACVVFKEGENASEEELNEFLLIQFPKYQLPEKYITLKEIPRTGIGKFDKRKMRKMYSEGKLV